jgi:SPP1 family predicted phage head-tail adaptor
MLTDFLQKIGRMENLFGQIKTIKGSEYFAASSTQNETVSRFVIHYTEGLHPDMRILYKKKPTSKERTFSIESIINDDEADKTMTIIVKEAIV